MKPRLIIGNKNYSSWSLRPWLLMKEAGIDFDEHRIALDTPTTKQEIAAVTDAGRVPVLQIGDLTVWDSLAICETVAERWPDKRLWPEDPDERAHARAISAEMHAGFQVLRDCMPMNCRAMGRKVLIPDELGKDIDRVIANGSDEGYLKAFTRSGREVVLEYRNRLIAGRNGQPEAVQEVLRRPLAAVRTQLESRPRFWPAPPPFH